MSKVTYNGIDLTPPTYAGTYTIDPLGAETPAQRTERKEQESLGGQLLNIFIVTVVLFVAAVALMASGIYIGATKPEVWNYVPFTADSPCDYVDGPCEVSPSGERAEPEHVPGPTLEREKP